LNEARADDAELTKDDRDRIACVAARARARMDLAAPAVGVRHDELERSDDLVRGGDRHDAVFHRVDFPRAPRELLDVLADDVHRNVALDRVVGRARGVECASQRCHFRYP
jgi:hypothetical protein